MTHQNPQNQAPRVVVVDTSAEISGDGLEPHPAISGPTRSGKGPRPADNAESGQPSPDHPEEPPCPNG